VSKYRNKRTNGYASKREAKRAAELKLLEKAGEIKELREQVKFELVPKEGKERAVSYIADFRYQERVDNLWHDIVEDVKGFKTPIYRLKKRLMAHVHGIRIRET
jgi:hypothetical protein